MVEPDETRLFAMLALGAFGCAVITGEVLAGRLAPAGWRSRVFRIHRAAAVSGLCLVGLHVTTVVLVWHAGLTGPEGDFPGSSATDHGLMVLGLLSLAALAAVGASWMLRRRLGRRAGGPVSGSVDRGTSRLNRPTGPGRRALGAGPRWMVIHQLAYVGFTGAVLHAYLAHPGGPQVPESVAYALGLGIVVVLLPARRRRMRGGPGGDQRPGLHAVP